MDLMFSSPQRYLLSYGARQREYNCKPFPKRQILDSSELNEFVDDNFKFVENGRKLSKGLENTVGEGEIARYEQFLLLPQYFQKTCTADQGLLGKGLNQVNIER